MILKTVAQDTGRWAYYESDKIELGKMWVGMFGERGDPGTQLALFAEPEEPRVNPDAPVARKVPILLGRDAGGPENGTDLLVDCHYLKEVFETDGEVRKQVGVAVLRKANGEGQIVVFGQPAYLMNDAGKTVEKL